MSSQLGRHGLGKSGSTIATSGVILEVGQRIFNALVIIGNYGERGHLGGECRRWKGIARNFAF